jgi:acetoin utilization protein AcuB
MTREPITIGPDDLLSEAREKMQAGGFRRLPVIRDGRLIGILTDRDLRAHLGCLERVRVNGVMNENVHTIASTATLEQAAQSMRRNQIGGLPVVDRGGLVGIITSSDILDAFLDVMGASEAGSTRIDVVLEGEEHSLVEASRIVSKEGGEILGIGTYREKIGENPVCYLRVLSADIERIDKALHVAGFDVLGLHSPSAP